MGLRHPNPRPSSFSLYSRQSPSLAGNHCPPSATRHRREKETTGPLPTRHRPSTTTTLHPPLLTAEPTQKNHALPAQFHHPRAGIWPPTPPSTSSINVGAKFSPKSATNTIQLKTRVWVLQPHVGVSSSVSWGMRLLLLEWKIMLIHVGVLHLLPYYYIQKCFP